MQTLTEDEVAPLEKTPEEVLVERVGKVEVPEFYSSTTQFLVMFPNDYSVLVTEGTKSNRSISKVYWGIADVTKRFLPSKLSTRMSVKDVNELIDKIAIIPME